MRILATIANFGTNNDQYLERVIQEYRSMPYDVHVVVFSDRAKNWGRDVEHLVVDLKGRDPWTLPFAHKRIMADRADDYELFIYSEDDTLISKRNIDAFLKLSEVLADNEIAGFLNTDIAPNGEVHFCNMSSHFHWQPDSLVIRGEYQLAYFSNEHSAAFLLTRSHLKRALQSGGFLVEPHQGKYDWPCTASTDPYTQCGFRKLICISHIEEFLTRHLPDKYAGRPYGRWREVRKQLDALIETNQNGGFKGFLFPPETKLPHCKWSKNYYEPINERVLALVVGTAREVLSVGCGWAATERELVKQGVRVAGVPIDSIIATSARDNGIEIVSGDFESAREKLVGRRFDCLILSNVLHLVPDPVRVLSSYVPLLSKGGRVIVVTPNIPQLPTLIKSFRRGSGCRDLRSYTRSGLHITSRGSLREWFRQANVRTEQILNLISPGKQRYRKLHFGCADGWMADDLIAIGRFG